MNEFVYVISNIVLLLIILGLLLGLGWYIGKLMARIDEIGYMTALLLDHLEVPGCTSEDCEIETISDLQQMLVIPPSNISTTPVIESSGWRAWDKEEE